MKKDFLQVVKQSLYKNEEGFTFIELVTTLVIIGILASAALARYLDLNQVAKAHTCIGNQIALETAQTLYYTECYLNGDGHYADELDQLAPYLNNNLLPYCPSGGEYIILPAGVVECSLDEHNPE